MSDPLVTAQIYGTIGRILLAIQQIIVDATGLDPASVFITRRKDIPKVVAEKAVALWVRGEAQDGEALNAAGLTNDMRLRRVTVIVWTRNLSDEVDRDTSRLTDFSLGQLNFEDRVYAAVQLCFPQDNAQNLIVDMPPQCGPISDPVADGQNGDFTRSEFDLMVRYNRDRTQTDQDGNPL